MNGNFAGLTRNLAAGQGSPPTLPLIDPSPNRELAQFGTGHVAPSIFPSSSLVSQLEERLSHIHKRISQTASRLGGPPGPRPIPSPTPLRSIDCVPIPKSVTSPQPSDPRYPSISPHDLAPPSSPPVYTVNESYDAVIDAAKHQIDVATAARRAAFGRLAEVEDFIAAAHKLPHTGSSRGATASGASRGRTASTPTCHTGVFTRACPRDHHQLPSQSSLSAERGAFLAFLEEGDPLSRPNTNYTSHHSGRGHPLGLDGLDVGRSSGVFRSASCGSRPLTSTTLRGLSSATTAEPLMSPHHSEGISQQSGPLTDSAARSHRAPRLSLPPVPEGKRIPPPPPASESPYVAMLKAAGRYVAPPEPSASPQRSDPLSRSRNDRDLRSVLPAENIGPFLFNVDEFSNNLPQRVFEYGTLDAIPLSRLPLRIRHMVPLDADEAARRLELVNAKIAALTQPPEELPSAISSLSTSSRDSVYTDTLETPRNDLREPMVVGSATQQVSSAISGGLSGPALAEVVAANLPLPVSDPIRFAVDEGGLTGPELAALLASSLKLPDEEEDAVDNGGPVPQESPHMVSTSILSGRVEEQADLSVLVGDDGSDYSDSYSEDVMASQVMLGTPRVLVPYTAVDEASNCLRGSANDQPCARETPPIEGSAKRIAMARWNTESAAVCARVEELEMRLKIIDLEMAAKEEASRCRPPTVAELSLTAMVASELVAERVRSAFAIEAQERCEFDAMMAKQENEWKDVVMLEEVFLMLKQKFSNRIEAMSGTEVQNYFQHLQDTAAAKSTGLASVITQLRTATEESAMEYGDCIGKHAAQIVADASPEIQRDLYHLFRSFISASEVFFGSEVRKWMTDVTAITAAASSRHFPDRVRAMEKALVMDALKTFAPGDFALSGTMDVIDVVDIADVPLHVLPHLMIAHDEVSILKAVNQAKQVLAIRRKRIETFLDEYDAARAEFVAEARADLAAIGSYMTNLILRSQEQEMLSESGYGSDLSRAHSSALLNSVTGTVRGLQKTWKKGDSSKSRRNAILDAAGDGEWMYNLAELDASYSAKKAEKTELRESIIQNVQAQREALLTQHEEGFELLVEKFMDGIQDIIEEFRGSISGLDEAHNDWSDTVKAHAQNYTKTNNRRARFISDQNDNEWMYQLNALEEQFQRQAVQADYLTTLVEVRSVDREEILKEWYSGAVKIEKQMESEMDIIVGSFRVMLKRLADGLSAASKTAIVHQGGVFADVRASTWVETVGRQALADLEAMLGDLKPMGKQQDAQWLRHRMHQEEQVRKLEESLKHSRLQRLNTQESAQIEVDSLLEDFVASGSSLAADETRDFSNILENFIATAQSFAQPAELTGAALFVEQLEQAHAEVSENISHILEAHGNGFCDVCTKASSALISDEAAREKAAIEALRLAQRRENDLASLLYRVNAARQRMIEEYKANLDEMMEAQVHEKAALIEFTVSRAAAQLAQGVSKDTDAKKMQRDLRQFISFTENFGIQSAASGTSMIKEHVTLVEQVATDASAGFAKSVVAVGKQSNEIEAAALTERYVNEAAWERRKADAVDQLVHDHEEGLAALLSESGVALEAVVSNFRILLNSNRENNDDSTRFLEDSIEDGMADAARQRTEFLKTSRATRRRAVFAEANDGEWMYNLETLAGATVAPASNRPASPLDNNKHDEEKDEEAEAESSSSSDEEPDSSKATVFSLKYAIEHGDEAHIRQRIEAERRILLREHDEFVNQLSNQFLDEFIQLAIEFAANSPDEFLPRVEKAKEVAADVAAAISSLGNNLATSISTAAADFDADWYVYVAELKKEIANFHDERAERMLKLDESSRMHRGERDGLVRYVQQDVKSDVKSLNAELSAATDNLRRSWQVVVGRNGLAQVVEHMSATTTNLEKYVEGLTVLFDESLRQAAIAADELEAEWHSQLNSMASEDKLAHLDALKAKSQAKEHNTQALKNIFAEDFKTMNADLEGRCREMLQLASQWRDDAAVSLTSASNAKAPNSSEMRRLLGLEVSREYEFYVMLDRHRMDWLKYMKEIVDSSLSSVVPHSNTVIDPLVDGNIKEASMTSFAASVVSNNPEMRMLVPSLGLGGEEKEQKEPKSELFSTGVKDSLQRWRKFATKPKLLRKMEQKPVENPASVIDETMAESPASVHSLEDPFADGLGGAPLPRSSSFNNSGYLALTKSFSGSESLRHLLDEVENEEDGDAIHDAFEALAQHMVDSGLSGIQFNVEAPEDEPDVPLEVVHEGRRKSMIVIEEDLKKMKQQLADIVETEMRARSDLESEEADVFAEISNGVEASTREAADKESARIAAEKDAEAQLMKQLDEDKQQALYEEKRKAKLAEQNRRAEEVAKRKEQERIEAEEKALICVAPPPAPPPEAPSDDRIIAHVEAAPASIATIDELKQYLFSDDWMKPATDAQRVTCLYYWICRHIAIDAAAYGSKSQPTVDEIMLHRAALSPGFALLMKTLCDAVDIECEVITGFVKMSYNYTTGANLSPALDNSWNVVKIAGSWQIVDCVCGTGVLVVTQGQPTFIARFCKSWLFVPPEEAIFTHYPNVPKWQLLGQLAWDAEQYFAAACMRPHSLSYGISLLSGRTWFLQSDDGNISISLSMARTGVFLGAGASPIDLNTRQAGAPLPASCFFVSPCSRTVTVAAALPADTYIFEIYAKLVGEIPENSTESWKYELQPIISYVIEVTNSSTSILPRHWELERMAELGISLPDDASVHDLQANDEGVVEFDVFVNESSHFIARSKISGSDSKDSLPTYVRQDPYSERCEFYALFPSAGSYTIELFGRFRPGTGKRKSGGEYAFVGDLTVLIKPEDEERVRKRFEAGFPTLSSAAATFALNSPKTKYLTAGQKYLFDWTVPAHCTALSLKQGGAWSHLVQDLSERGRWTTHFAVSGSEEIKILQKTESSEGKSKFVSLCTYLVQDPGAVPAE